MKAMSFRAGEEAQRGYERARTFLAPVSFGEAKRTRAVGILDGIVAEHGPVVDAYPSWHPLVPQPTRKGHWPTRTPDASCGYPRLDHAVFFVNAILACPYAGAQADAILGMVNATRFDECVDVTAEEIHDPLYNDGTRPILIRCEWRKDLEDGHTIPRSLALPLMLERELPRWRQSEVPESWETMRPYFLGGPHGNRSSLFVTQETGTALKNTFVGLAENGVFGAW